VTNSQQIPVVIELVDSVLAAHASWTIIHVS
jgi:hypothetical protein